MSSHRTTTIRWLTACRQWPISPTEENSDYAHDGLVWRTWLGRGTWVRGERWWRAWVVAVKCGHMVAEGRQQI
ncbi:ADP-ribosylation factor-like protein 10 [Gossypium arboreum]|uniref:ADP-ribosylation factor-like protein 10 n=1 Tax=Gossypium arboreum TaxID=29729 RepID=A0A0B0MM51_GOSAR|nr:ADP-ribosylation factor-like protein 10 [Gossypium arboreum]